MENIFDYEDAAKQPVEEVENQDELTETQSVEEKDETVETEKEKAKEVETEKSNATKLYSERLKSDRDKIRKDLELEIAQSFGYDTYENYVKAQSDKKLLDEGLDPEKVRPLLKEVWKTDPEYVELNKFKAEKERVEQELWVKNSLFELNNEFGLNIKDISEIDTGTIELWKKGIPLVNAFAANNYNKIKPKKVETDRGVSHLKNLPSSGNSETLGNVLTKEHLNAFKKLNPKATEEDIQKFINKNKK